ncbi:hypothetical protein F1880_007387 [Penicillium rolfsii]|nr:hypothetical protein F1880_007387 [Penicillium rolfsii]
MDVTLSLPIPTAETPTAETRPAGTKLKEPGVTCESCMLVMTVDVGAGCWRDAAVDGMGYRLESVGSRMAPSAAVEK